MGKVMNAVAISFAMIAMLFFGLSAIMGGFEDLANANMTTPANNTLDLTQNLFFPFLNVIPGVVWLLFISIVIVILFSLWRH